jgi:NAD(P)-dependent dehydrogenase (short-subunit alcohol dehydrogenase family)
MPDRSPRSTSPVYVILGATGGIGSALCRRLSRDAAQLVIGARDAAKLNALSNEIDAHPFPLDATDIASVEACIALAIERYGRLDGVANCVGSLLLKPAHLTSEAEWQATLTVNLGSAFATVRAAVRAMTETGGSIVLVSSVAARLGLANHEAIAAAKAGVGGLVLSAAASYAARGIRVNAVAPGMVRTPLTARLTQSEAALKASTAMHPLGRIGDPEDVASAIAWLLTPEQSWITGQILSVDGGFSTVQPRAATSRSRASMNG